MSRIKFGLVVLITTNVLAPRVARGEQAVVAPSTEGLVVQLLDSDWSARSDAYARLRAIPSALGRKDVRLALLSLLDREDRLIESTLRESHETVGVADRYGEAFAEYVGELGDAVESFVDWTDAQQVCVLTREWFNQDSPFAGTLAEHGTTTIPCLIQNYASDVGLMRAQAAPLIARALAEPGLTLQSPLLQSARTTILDALRDPSEAVRANTVRALGSYGDKEALPLLLEVAEKDPANNGEYWIRKRAVVAIADIERRAQSGLK